jgi:lysozyme
MKTSKAGADLIRKYEGCKLTAYQDVIGKWTIGWGHTGPEVREGLTITKAEAEEILATRLANEFEPGVMEAIGYAPVTQPQFDAMISLAYNIGVGAFAKSTLARLHRTGEYYPAAEEFMRWTRAGGRVLKGLTRRRAEERDLYLSEAPAPVGVGVDRDLLADLIRATQRVVGATPDGRLGAKTVAKITEAQKA